jgi:uncharacterized protein (TIGR02118 family)
MVKLIVLYGHPTDPAAFEEHYANTHIPLVGHIPSLRRFEASRVADNPDGSRAPYYRIAELWFDDQAQLQASTGSPEGRATAADVGNFATGGATVLVAAID